jgi:NAD dependent epimerase/dehydratase family enzyme
LPVPAFALRMALGGMATLILDGMYILPKRLQELGYPFQFKTAEAALGNLLAG